MNDVKSPGISDRDRLDSVLAEFLRQGFARSEPAILQPASVFLDRSGEDFRGRLYLTSDASGSDFCLRPEFTISVCLDYLASAQAGGPAAFAYGGSVFRFPAEHHRESGEFLQAGLESFGREDREAADAEILASALEAARAAGAGALELRMGDAGLVSNFLDRLDLPPAWRRRLETGYARGDSIDKIFAVSEKSFGSEQAGVLAALKKVEPEDARALVNDLLSIAGISTVGGRSANEIAERFLEQASLGNDQGVAAEKRELVERFLSIEGHPDLACASLRRLADDARLDLGATLELFRHSSGLHRGARRRSRQHDLLGELRAAARLLFGLRVRSAQRDVAKRPSCDRRRSLRQIAENAWRAKRHSSCGRRNSDRPPPARRRRALRRRRMTSPGKLIVAAPSKGRLQENAAAFFARAGLELTQGRGARDYRGTLNGVDNVEVAFLSASEITSRLANGDVHLGVTGEDLVRETIADADKRIELLAPLGFGGANVVVAVPQAWIDVRGMTDLADVAHGFRARHGRGLRVATKYIHMTRRFFTEHDVGDYRIVESSGATEGAPAAGSADLIVDITTTGATLKANALKILDDGVILRSQANLVASLTTPWNETAREAARIILSRIAAEEEARTTREVRVRLAHVTDKLIRKAESKFGATPRDGGEDQSMTFSCPASAVPQFADWLINHGAKHVTSAKLDYVFHAENALWNCLAARLDAAQR